MHFSTGTMINDLIATVDRIMRECETRDMIAEELNTFFVIESIAVVIGNFAPAA
jgi:hypothetical protein